MDKIKELQGQWAQGKAYPYLINSLIFLLLVAWAFAIYFPSIQGPFIFDDKPNILYSPAVRMTEFSFVALKKAALEGAMITRPAANISFALNYLAGQYNATGYHVVNILIHAVTGFLLYLFFRVTLQIIDRSGERKSSVALPLVAALIWFVHPLQSQTVAYIVQRMTSLSAMFYLLAMLLYAYARLTCHQRNRTVLFIGSTLAALLALASKEIAATLPLFIFLYEWYFFQNLKWDWLKKRLLYISMAAGSFLVIALVFLGSNPIGRILSGYQVRDFTLAQRLLTELRVVVFYMGQLLFPHPARLSLEHGIQLSSSLLSPMTTLFSALFLVTLIGAAVWLAKRERLASFALVWYLGNLMIESSVIGLEIIFEHRNYLPSMFLVWLVVVLGERFIRAYRTKLVLAGMIIILFSFWTYERSTVWADDETLIRDCIKKAPDKFRMYYNLGIVLYNKGKYDEAISTYQQALRVYPKDTSAKGINILYSNLGKLYTNLGNALSSTGKYDEGSTAYYQALRIYPEDANAYLGLGNNFLLQRNYNEAMAQYRKALLITKDPGLIFQIRRGLGLTLQSLGRFQEALNQYSVALRIQPGSRQINSSIYELRQQINAQK